MVRTLAKFDIMMCLSPGQRCVKEYWACTKYSDLPLVFIECLAAFQLVEHVTVKSVHTSLSATSLFFECTEFSRNRLTQARAVFGHQVSDVVQAWQDQFQVDSKSLLCMNMPSPHAFLVALKAWPSYAFPLAAGRVAAGMGLRYVSKLLRQLQPDGVGVHAHEVLGENFAQESLLVPSKLQAIADFIRRAAESLPALKDEATSHVKLLQKTVDHLVQDAQASSRHAFALKDVGQRLCPQLPGPAQCFARSPESKCACARTLREPRG